METEIPSNIYTAPECLEYSPCKPSLDIWATGCIYAKLLLGKSLFDHSGDLLRYVTISRLMAGERTSNQDPTTEEKLSHFRVLATESRFGSDTMSDESENSGITSESLMDKITEKFHGDDSSSSSSSSDAESEKPESPSSVKAKVYRLFGRENPVHKVLGGGKPADVFLWRNKKISASVIGGATAIWIFLELLEYHLLTLVCHVMILALAVLFLWSNVSTFIHKSPPHIPKVHLPEEPFLELASALTMELNMVFAVLRDIASGREVKKFIMVIAGLWVISIVGSWCNFLTLFYTCFVLLHTVPVLYEKYEDKVDPFAEKATIEIKKQYAVFDDKVLSRALSKLPKRPLKGKSA